MNNECVIFKGLKDKNGYGRIIINGKPIKAHRLAYRLYHPKSGNKIRYKLICHHCDNPSCINPEHLFIGTPKDNTQDAVNKGRHHSQKITHCPKGHIYDTANTYLQPSKRSGNKTRVCRICKNIRERINYHKRHSLK